MSLRGNAADEQPKNGSFLPLKQGEYYGGPSMSFQNW